MREGKKGKIAVLLPHIYDEYNVQLRVGIEEQAKKDGYRLVYFTNFSDNTSLDSSGEQSDAYDEGECAVFQLIHYEDFDAVIMLNDSFEESQRIHLKDVVNNPYHCPVINFRTTQVGAINIVADDDISFAEVIQHFIDVHHCKKIDLLTGPEVNVHSLIRLQVYKNTLEKNNIPYDENRVYYGNFWKNCGEDIWKQMKEREQELPDVVICANDYMAMSLLDEMEKEDILAPRDLLVSGYDDMEEGRYHVPSLTTVRQPVESMGRKSVEIVSQLVAGENVDEEIRMPSEIVLRGSCGCGEENPAVVMSYASVLADRLYKTALLEASTTTLVTFMANTSSIKDCLRWIEHYVLKETGFKSFALCLEEKWEQELPLPDDQYIYQDRTVNMLLGIHNGQRMEPQQISVRKLLPDEFAEDENESYFIIPIHYLRNYYGYAVFAIEYNIPLSTNMKSWFLHLESALENIRIRDKLNAVVNELGELYQRDTLTGLYNRRGFNHYSKEFYQICETQKTNFMLMEIDMDGLKSVNDLYGHEDGDLCIISIANALKSAAKNGEVCIRSGGDEYIVVGKNYTEEMLEQYQKDFYTYLDGVNARLQKPYTIGASMGAYMIVPDGTDLEEYLKIADHKMYANKKQRKGL